MEPQLEICAEWTMSRPSEALLPFIYHSASASGVFRSRVISTCSRQKGSIGLAYTWRGLHPSPQKLAAGSRDFSYFSLSKHLLFQFTVMDGDFSLIMN